MTYDPSYKQLTSILPLTKYRYPIRAACYGVQACTDQQALRKIDPSSKVTLIHMSILKTLVKVHAHCRLVSWVLGSYLKYEICIFSTSHNCVLEHFHKNHVQCGFCLRLTEWIQGDHFELWLRIDEKTSFMQCKE